MIGRERTYFVLTLLLPALLIGGVLLSGNNPEAGQLARGAGALNFVEFELDNGLDVILVEDHSAPTVTVDVWYEVGGANDPERRSGFAHLFEHMMFQGSAHLDKLEHGELVEAAGGRLNAFTRTEITGYWDALPSNQLPLGLWLEAERMSSLAVTQENLDNQRAVVIEEFQQRVGNAPYGEAVQDLSTLPYDYAPYRKRVIGSIEDLNQATVSDVREFHATHYVPNNATLVVAGDFNVGEARAMVEEFFGAIPRGDAPPPLPPYEPAARSEPQILTVQDPLANVPALLIAYVVPPRDHPDFVPLQTLAALLSAGRSSRLGKLMIDTGLAAVADVGVQGNRGPGLYTVVLVANAGVELETLEQMYGEEIDRILAEGVEPEELEKVINQIRSGQLVGLETSFGLAESVQAANFYFDDPEAIFTAINRFEAVTNADLQRVISEYLAPERRTAMTVTPGGAASPPEAPPPVVQEAAEGDEEVTAAFILEQDTPPAPLPVSAFNLPEITETTLSNGLDVVVINRPELPIISLDFALPGGGKALPPEQAGLAGMTAAVWTRGTNSRSAQDIAGAIEQVGGAVGAFATNDRLNIGAFALIEDAPLAFELLGDMVLNPSFPESEIEVVRQNMLTGLRFQLADPGSLAGRAFSRSIWGEHPYGNITTEETVAALTRDDVLDYYDAQFDPDSALLIVAGDITVEEALELAGTVFGGLELDGETPELALPEPPAQDRLNIYLVDRPGSTQVDFLIGNIATHAGAPDRYDIQVMNEILGGGFSSRLFGNIREDKGYAYSVGSGFSANVESGTFIIRTAVRTEVAAEALQEIINEVERLQSEAVPQDELERVKASLTGSFALQLETYQDFVNQVAAMRLNGLPFDTLAAFPENIAAVDQSAVQAAAQGYLHPERFVIVAVGDAAVVEASLSEIAPVTLLEAA